MGALVSTLLSLGTHAEFVSQGSGVLCSPAMTYVMKTHSSLLLRFVLALYPIGSFVFSCTIAFHFDHFHPFGLKPASLGLVFKPTFDHDDCKILLAYLWPLQLDTPWPVEGTHLWVLLTSFRLPAFSIGMFQSQELDHLFRRHAFFPLYYSILLFLFHLKEKDKKNYIFKKSQNGTIFPFIVGS